jgi:hypothetical protein
MYKKIEWLYMGKWLVYATASLIVKAQSTFTGVLKMSNIIKN